MQGRQRRRDEDITVKLVTINMYFHTDITLWQYVCIVTFAHPVILMRAIKETSDGTESFVKKI